MSLRENLNLRVQPTLVLFPSAGPIGEYKKTAALILAQMEVKKIRPDSAQLHQANQVKRPLIFNSETSMAHLPSVMKKTPAAHLSSFMKKQMDQARIPQLRRNLAQLHRAHSPFNDGVELDAFQPSDMTYAGKQRKGTHGNFESCASMQDRVRRALGERFRLASPDPLPEHIKKASVSTRDCPPDVLAEFWGSQLPRLEQMVDDSKLAQQKWNGEIPPEIAPSDGELKTVAISQLLRHFGVEGQRWTRLFALGFPTAGTHSQLKAFKEGKEIPPLVRTSQLFRSAPGSFRERAVKSGMANAQQLWEEATAQVGKGWLAPPLPLRQQWKSPGMESEHL